MTKVFLALLFAATCAAGVLMSTLFTADPVATKVQGPDTAGNPLQIATSGVSDVQVEGNISNGATDGGNPVKVGGVGSSANLTPVTNGQRVNAHFSLGGHQVVAQTSAVATSDGTSSSAVYTQADSATTIPSSGMLFNGATWDRQRGPTIFKTQATVAVGTETTIWTPQAGKKFRLMGFDLTASAAVTLTFRDNTAGTVIFIHATGAGGPGQEVSFGNGIVSAAANNVLTCTSSAAANLIGVVWGTEE